MKNAQRVFVRRVQIWITCRDDVGTKAAAAFWAVGGDELCEKWQDETENATVSASETGSEMVDKW